MTVPEYAPGRDPTRPPAGDAATGVAGRRIAALDGLRGIAILLVMVQNLYPSHPSTSAVDQAVMRAVNAGWTGVDLFFVLSGFLITGILLDAKQGDGYFRNFYARRVLRIFPLYYGVLVFLFLGLPHLDLLRADALRPLLDVQGWYWSYTTNFLIALGDWSAAPLSTDHFWSLAVEEQFYLVWPVIVLMTSRRRLAQVCVGLIAAALALRIAGRLEGVSPTALYALTPTRIDALATGGLIAALGGANGLSGRHRRWLRRCAVALGGLVVALWWWRGGLPYRDPVIQTVGYTIIAATCASVLLEALQPGSATARMLAVPGLRALGRYSYAMYVFHPLVLLAILATVPPARRIPSAGGQQWPGAIVLMLAAATVTIALAVASWHLYERRFLELKRYFAYPSEREQRKAPHPSA